MTQNILNSDWLIYIQNALCHGSKNTSLADSNRNLDIARTVSSAGGVKQQQQQQQQQQQHSSVSTSTKHNTKCMNGNPQPGLVTSNTNIVLKQNLNNINNNVKYERRANDNEGASKDQGNNNNLLKSDPLTRPAPKKTVIQVQTLISFRKQKLKH